MDLDTPLEQLNWIPRPRILPLRRLALVTVGDLLTHYPRRHEDRREFSGFPGEESITPLCLCGEVVKTRSEEHTSELQSHSDLVCRLLLEKKKKNTSDSRTLSKS